MAVVEKRHYGTTVRAVGVVERVLTRAAEHPRGFKVLLSDGVVGRCTEIREVRNQGAFDEDSRGLGASLATQSSDDFLAAIEEELATPPPGIRLRDQS